ncbi:MAG TPA: DNA replication/repair protein RecF [Bacteroidales bacterium]|nr:DNA replication/repair protein RecF [Bacteroidales bacterium]HRR92481.1 DNA replication/repair protein RecF [Bacteroidales bacterium]HRT89917.1 DNA replication/repair protein RecF [Bacteroidales bacterium]
MYLKKLSLTNFKNYKSASFEFSPRINCFVGSNGAGKTNILDSIHYLSLAKSFYSNIDSISINHGEDYFIIEGVFSEDAAESSVVCSFHRQKQKVLKRNGKEYERLIDHVGRYPVVMISPADSALVTEGSEERRRFLNKIISQYDPEYLDCILNYNKVILQRNRLLKSYGKSGNLTPELTEAYDLQLVKYGEYIHRERSRLVDELTPVFNDYYTFISSGNEMMKLSYRSQLSGTAFTELLRKNAEKDRVLEYTTAGIHKDDLVFELNGYPVRTFGSQGQQKSFLVALKLAKFDYIKRKTGLTPILLLDDIFDKFDSERVEKIIKLAGNHRFAQIFITDTDEMRMKGILARLDVVHRLFRIAKDNEIEIVSELKTDI